MSDLQQIEYLKGRIDQLEWQIKLERSAYDAELLRISKLLSGGTKVVSTSINNLRQSISNNRKDSEILFSTLWKVND